MKRFALVLFLGICFFAFTSSTTPINPVEKEFGVVVNEIMPFGTVINPCGEPVLIEGVFHILIRETQSGNGNFHNGFHINAKGKGVGLISGIKYEWNDVIKETLNLTQGGSGCCGNSTELQRWRIIGQGNAPDFFLDSSFHITVNANGEFTVDMGGFDVTCK